MKAMRASIDREDAEERQQKVHLEANRRELEKQLKLRHELEKEQPVNR